MSENLQKQYHIKFAICLDKESGEEYFGEKLISLYEEIYNNFDQPLDIRKYIYDFHGIDNLDNAIFQIESIEKINNTWYISFEVKFYRELSFCESREFRPIIWNFIDGMKAFDNILFLWKFGDEYLTERQDFNYNLITYLENEIREVVSKIFYKRYAPEWKYLLGDIKNLSTYTYEKDSDIIKYNGGNIFSSFLFSDYGKLTEIDDKINMKELLQKFINSNDFDDFKIELQNRGIQGKDLDFLLSISDDIKIITEMRNLLAHNNSFFKQSIEKTRAFIGKFEQAHISLKEKIDLYKYPTMYEDLNSFLE